MHSSAEDELHFFAQKPDLSKKQTCTFPRFIASKASCRDKQPLRASRRASHSSRLCAGTRGAAAAADSPQSHGDISKSQEQQSTFILLFLKLPAAASPLPCLTSGGAAEPARWPWTPACMSGAELERGKEVQSLDVAA